MNENTRPGQSVGSAIRARDRDSLTYKRVDAGGDHEGDAAKFDINKSTGQILTKASLNHEDPDCGYVENDDPDTTCTYTVKVQVRDGKDEHGNKEEEDAPDDDTLDDEITVQIIVRDVNETPVAPKVTVTSPLVASGATEATLVVTWNKPDNTGPAIDGYVVECSGAGITSSNPCPQPTASDLSDLTAEEQSYNITGLTPNSSYQVRVRARNAEGLGTWSTSERQSTSKAGNAIPTIATPTPTPEVSEDARSGSAVSGDPVLGDDSDSTHQLTYEIEGPNDDLFTIDTSGQIKTRMTLNHEDPRCYDDSSPNDTECTYTVRVKVADRDNGSASANVTIEVTDEPEPPSAPATPTVTATADTGRSLEVTWNEPTNTGPPIASYQVAYRKYRQGTNSDEYEVIDHASTERKVAIAEIGDPAVPLEPQTQYEVRVRATNGEGTPAQDESVAWGDWSPLRRASTGASNVRPVFANMDSLITLLLPENTRSGQNVGSAVEATDADRGNRLTYSLEGPGKDSFTITSTGQIRTKSGVTYDYETRQSYSVTVKVDDGQRKDNSVATKSVTIDVEDRKEPPSTPSAPMVVGISGSTDSVRVTWTEPGNTGPPITDYGVLCQNCPEIVSHDGADRSMIITGLTPGTRYDVQVRAWNAEGHSDWSTSGTGTPNADVTNQVPIFSGGARTFSVVENTVAAGDPIGNPVTAVDPDLDTVTHTLEGTDAASFTVDAGSGQIRATATLNYEDRSSYSISVKATDTRGGSATVGVTITVTDVDEPPDTPSLPTVTAASSTSLQVTWDAPENTGPPITDYDYRHREPPGAWTEVTNTTITVTTVTISGLAASTSYDVEVRATNAEGTSDWSNSGYGLTAAAGANSPPVFTEGTSATRSVSASASAGTSIGQPVTATDADSGDTLTYTLEGTHAASFDIRPTTGQLITRAGVTLTTGTTYEITVVASDGTDSARVAVTITATAAPPNNPPAFSDGSSTTRSVSASAPAGTRVGQPVTATDADSGDTLTYSLEGTDAASFDINTSNGQILTRSGVTLTVGTTYEVTVAASDGTASTSITVTISVVLNNRPTFSSTSATRSVDENSPAGTDIGLPVSATDANAGDTLTYRLSGADAASFNIVSGTGQLRTNAALDYETDSRYSAMVTVSDGELTNSISVTINVADMHPGCAYAVGNGANTGLVNDCEALLDSKETLEGATGSLNWATFTPIAQWDGITLRGTPKRVARLLLRKMPQLDGTIPGALGRLSGLESLSLYANGLTGPIPDELGELTNLEMMYINNNNLSGTIPAELGNLTNLERLWLHRNNLSGSIPTELGSLSNLQWLSAYGNSLTGSIPTELGDLTNLKVLYLHRNNLTGSIPTELGDLTNLQSLYLWGNELTGAIPTQLGGLSNLRVLSLGRNRLTGAIPTELGNLSKLERLYIYGDKTRSMSLDGGIPTELGNMTKLTTLVLQYAGLTGTIPTQLGNMTDLEWLNIQDNRLTGTIPPQLGSLSNLEVLYLHFNQLTGTVPSELGNLSELTNLWLKSNRLSGSLPLSLNNLTNLERVRISRNPYLTGCIPAALTDSAGINSDAELLGLQTCPSGN